MYALQTRSLFTTLCVMALLLCAVTAGNVHAQNNDKVESLAEILNAPQDYGNDGKPLTPKIMANNYYKQCNKVNSYFLGPDEQNILCSCSAAKMSEMLTVQEFKDLGKPNLKGKDARGKMLAYAYAPCMEYAVKDVVQRDCMAHKDLREIVVGKSKICGCVINKYNTFLNENGTHIIMSALHYDPMTMNPLEQHYVEGQYDVQLNMFVRQCRYVHHYNQKTR